MSKSRRVADPDPDPNILLRQQLEAIRQAEETADAHEQSTWYGVANFAARDGRFYAPATEDLWFKFATGSDGGRVSSAFIKAVVALSFRHCNTELLTERTGNNMNKLVGLLPSRPSPERRVATDFAAVAKFRTQDENIGQKLKFVSSTKSEIIKKQPSLQSMTDIQEALPIIETLLTIENQSAILRDSIERGMIISSEMQVANKEAPEGYSDMINRADDYVAFLKQRDHGKGSANGRVLKLDSDGEVSRSVGEVVWEVSDNQQITQSVKCLAHRIAGRKVQTARGDIITFVPLVKVPQEISDGDRDSEEFQDAVMKLMRQMNSRVDDYFAERISAISNTTKDLVKQVANVINFSHLMWPKLVGTFLPEVQGMCENLRITGDSIMDIQSKGYQSEYIESILGRFRNAEREIEQERARADQEIEQAKRKSKNIVGFFRELGGSQDPKVRRTLLTKYGLVEKDVEVSGGTTPKSSPSKPKVKDSPSPSQKR